VTTRIPLPVSGTDIKIVSGLVAASILTIFIYFLRVWRHCHSFRSTTLDELAELVAALRERHLIISHLLDVAPTEIDRRFDRKQCGEACRKAEAAVEQIQLHRLDANQIRRLSYCEQELWRQSDGLIDAIHHHPQVQKDPAVAGCVAGLKRAEEKTKDAAAAFNTSVFTYSAQASRCPKLFRWLIANDPPIVVDLVPHYSSGSEYLTN